MASKQKFNTIISFPDNIPTLDMETVPLTGLLANDAIVQKQVFQACQKLGFFLLDLNNDAAVGKVMISEIDQLFDITKETLDLPPEIKAQYPVTPGKSLLG